jgi:cyanophycinase
MNKFTYLLSALFLLQACAINKGKQKHSSSATLVSSASLGITGDPNDVQTKTIPGLLLAGGGGDVDAAMQWLIDRSGGGDIVIIRASGSTGYNEYLYKLGKVNSVESLLINSGELAQNDTVVQIVRNAEALFIAGGDQWNYTQYWMGTPLNDAINYLVNKKKVPVGGTSAGLAILGEYFFDAKNGGITSDSALLNPFHEKMSINKGFIKSKWLTNLITDSHYSERNRHGRHVVMMANIMERHNIKPKGLGLDEKTVVAIDEKGDLQVFGSGKAWFLQAQNEKPEMMKPNMPFTWNHNEKAVSAYVIPASKQGTPAGNIKKWEALTGGTGGYISVDSGRLKMSDTITFGKAPAEKS